MAAARRILVRSIHLRRLKKLLEKNPQTEIDWVKSIYHHVFSPGNLQILITRDVFKISKPASAWGIIGAEFGTPNQTRR